MIIYFTDIVNAFRPEWQMPNVINGRPRKNKNSVPRDRTIGVYEDFTTGCIYISCAIRHLIDAPSTIGKTVARSRILKLLHNPQTTQESCVAMFNDRDEVYATLVEANVVGREVTEEANILHGYISQTNLDKAFAKVDKLKSRLLQNA